MDSPVTAGSIRKQHITEYGQVVQVVFGDIFADRVDAVVNGEANGNISVKGLELARRGGPNIQNECNTWVQQNGKLDDVSKCAITSGGNLPARHVLHSPGIMWYSGKRDEERKLRDAVYHCLECAHKNQLKSISFPPMSVTSLHSYPRDKCAKNMIEATLEWVKFRGMDTTISLIQFVSTEDENIKEFSREFDERFKSEGDSLQHDEDNYKSEGEEEEAEEAEPKSWENPSTLLAQKIKSRITITKDKRGVKRTSEGTFDKIRKSRRTDVNQDAMSMTQDADVMQIGPTQDDGMAISGASLAVTGENDVDLSLSDNDLFM